MRRDDGNRFGQNVRNELTSKGHKIDLKGTFSSGMGGGQAVMRGFLDGRVNYGASDPPKKMVQAGSGIAV